MTKRWGGVLVLVLALMAYGCETANGGDLGTGGSGGSAGSGGEGGSGGSAGSGGSGGMGGVGGVGGSGGTGGVGGVGGSGGTGGVGGSGGSGGMGGSAGSGGSGGTGGSCMPTAGVLAVLPTNPTTIVIPPYVDMANGFTITAPVRDVTTGIAGFGANAARSASAMDASGSAGDSLIIEFFDTGGGASTASNVGLTLNSAGTAGTVEVSVDDGAPVIETAAPGTTIPLAGSSAHKIQVSVPISDTTQIYWESLSYDHDCL